MQQNCSTNRVSVCYTYAMKSGCMVHPGMVQTTIPSRDQNEGEKIMNDTNTISFQPELIKRLNNTAADLSLAVAEAACAAVAQDKKVTVRTFATALRDAAPMLGTNNAVLAAAVKAAKVDKATLEEVTQAMADAADKKRRDDAKRAADKRAAAPGKALQKAQAEVEACKLAMRTPLEIARDNVAAAEAAVRAAAAALDAAVKREDEARAELARIVAALEAAPREA